jgi:hypothetical protein
MDTQPPPPDAPVTPDVAGPRIWWPDLTSPDLDPPELGTPVLDPPDVDLPDVDQPDVGSSVAVDAPGAADAPLSFDVAPDAPGDTADDASDAPDAVGAGDGALQDVSGTVILCRPWWSGSYGQRVPLEVAAGSQALPAAAWVAFTFNHAALVTAGQSRADGGDVRVVRFDGSVMTETLRFLDESSAWNGSATKIWFRALAPIGATAVDSGYALYTGNAAAAPPTTKAYAVVKSVQTGASSISVNGTVNVPITPVVPERSVLYYQARSGSDRPVGTVVRARIASANTLELARATDESPPARIDVRYYIVEYSNGVRVRRGSTVQGATTVNGSFSPDLASTAQAFVTWGKTAGATDYIWDWNDPNVVELRDLRTVQIRVDGIKVNHNVGWEVVELTNPADIAVQRGSLTLSTTALFGEATIAPVALDKAFVLVGFRSPGDGNDMGARMLAATFNGASKVRVDRQITGGGNDNLDEVAWQAVELRDGSFVQAATVDIGSNLAAGRATLPTAVDPARTIAFASVEQGAGQSMGSTPYASGDQASVCSATLTVSATEVQAERGFTSSSCRLATFVVQLPRSAAATASGPAQIAGTCP